MTVPSQSVLHPGGPDAAVIADMAWVLFGGGALLLAAVMALLVLSLRGEGRPVRSMRWIAGAGVAFPVAVLSVLLVWSTWHSGKLSAQTSLQPLRISVVAKMWWWEVRYHDPATGQDIVAANEIHLPAGRTAYVGITTGDVLHSLWIPALNGKMDAIPGRVTGLTLHAARPGVYRGQCAEFCGEQHARMALHVVAHTPQAFEAWLAAQGRPARPPAGALAAKGRDAFVAHKCVTCHTVRGVGAGLALGPDLTHVGSRSHIAAGTLRNHRGTLAGWIADPQAIKPGSQMPAAADMDGQTVLAIATWLKGLQ